MKKYKEVNPSRKNLLTIEKFNDWFVNAKQGDKIVYYRGSLLADTHPQSISKGTWDEYETYDNKRKAIDKLKQLGEYIMSKCATWIIEDHACVITHLGKLDLLQKKIRGATDKDHYYEYCATKL